MGKENATDEVTAEKQTTDETDDREKADSAHQKSAKAEFQKVLTLHKQLTDVGQFSYAGLCAVCLYRLFSEEWDKQFQIDTINRLVKHLEQTEQVKSSLTAIMNGQGDDSPDPYLSVLQKEEALQNRRSLLIEDLITVALLNGDYDSRMRTLIKYMSWQIHVSWDEMEKFEEDLVEMLKEEEHVQTEEEIAEKKKRETRSKIKRFALIGLATVGGGTIIGLTGGLAAPLLAAGAGAVIGGAGAAALGSVAGVAIIGSLFGAAGAGLGAYKMKRRLGGLEEFEFESLTEGNHLDITIAITGWLTEESRAPAGEERKQVYQGNASNKQKQKFVQKSAVRKTTSIDFKTPWMNLANSREQYCLRYESHYLEEMGKLMDYLMSFFMTAAAQEAIKYTVLSGILAAVAWPATLLSAASVIDNPWSVCAERAATTGKHLAEVLLSRLQGKRPVTLIGFSLGARVIYYCLEEMSRRKNCEGIIEEVVLLGAPVPGDPKVWGKFRRAVAGRIINGYCRGDWLLKFLYRTASVQFSIAGLGPVRLSDRRMHNVDLTDIVNGHTDYSKKIDEILRCVGIRTLAPIVVAKEATDLDKDQFEIVDYPSPDSPNTEGSNVDKLTPKTSEENKTDEIITKAQEVKDSEQNQSKSGKPEQLSSEEMCKRFQEVISAYSERREANTKAEKETSERPQEDKVEKETDRLHENKTEKETSNSSHEDKREENEQERGDEKMCTRPVRPDCDHHREETQSNIFNDNEQLDSDELTSRVKNIVTESECSNHVIPESTETSHPIDSKGTTDCKESDTVESIEMHEPSRILQSESLDKSELVESHEETIKATDGLSHSEPKDLNPVTEKLESEDRNKNLVSAASE